MWVPLRLAILGICAHRLTSARSIGRPAAAISVDSSDQTSNSTNNVTSNVVASDVDTRYNFDELMQGADELISLYIYEEKKYFEIDVASLVPGGDLKAGELYNVKLIVDDSAGEQVVRFENGAYSPFDFFVTGQSPCSEYPYETLTRWSLDSLNMKLDEAIHRATAAGVPPPYNRVKIFWPQRNYFGRGDPSELIYFFFKPDRPRLTQAIVGAWSGKVRKVTGSFFVQSIGVL